MDYLRRFLLLLSVIFLIPSLGFAKKGKHPTQNTFGLPTAAQLIKLDVKTRAKVLEIVREFLLNRESQVPGMYSEYQRSVEIQALMDFLMPSAEAKEYSKGDFKGMCLYGGLTAKFDGKYCQMVSDREGCTKARDLVSGGPEVEAVPCNALIFGLDDDGNSLCVAHGNHATRDCLKLSPDVMKVSKQIPDIMKKTKTVDIASYSDALDYVNAYCTIKDAAKYVNSGPFPPPSNVDPKGDKTTDCDRMKRRIEELRPQLALAGVPAPAPPPAPEPPKVDSTTFANVCTVWADFEASGINSSRTLAMEKTSHGFEGILSKSDGTVDSDLKFRSFDAKSGKMLFRLNTKDDESKDRKFEIKVVSIDKNNPNGSLCTSQLEAGDQAAAQVDVCSQGEVFCSGYDKHAACLDKGTVKYTYKRKDKDVVLDREENGTHTVLTENKKGDFKAKVQRDAKYQSQLEDDVLSATVIAKDHEKLQKMVKNLNKGPGNGRQFRNYEGYLASLMSEGISPDVLAAAKYEKNKGKYIKRDANGSISEENCHNDAFQATDSVTDKKGHVFGPKASWLDGTVVTNTFVCVTMDKKGKAKLDNWEFYTRVLVKPTTGEKFFEIGMINPDGDVLKRTVYKGDSPIPYVEQEFAKDMQSSDPNKESTIGRGSNKYIPYDTTLNKCPYPETFTTQPMNEVRFTTKPKQMVLCQGSESGHLTANTDIRLPYVTDDLINGKGKVGTAKETDIKIQREKMSDGRHSCDFSNSSGTLISLSPSQDLQKTGDKVTPTGTSGKTE